MPGPEFVYSPSRNAWGVRNETGQVEQVPIDAVPADVRAKMLAKYQPKAGQVQDPRRAGFGVRIGPVSESVQVQSGVTTAEKNQQEKLARQGEDVLAHATELQNLYKKKIKPKLDKGDIHSTGQGLIYMRRGWARGLGEQLDPDVSEFIEKAGPFAQEVNAYYNATGGGRASAIGFKTITVPHIPHAPNSMSEVLGGINPFSSEDTPQWDLEQQGEQLQNIIDYVQLTQKQRPIKTYGGAQPGTSPLEGAGGKATATPGGLSGAPGMRVLDGVPTTCTGKMTPDGKPIYIDAKGTRHVE